MINEFKSFDVDRLVQELLKDYPECVEDISRIKTVMGEIETCTDKSKLEIYIEELQGLNNKLYSLKNTEMLIELQVFINKYRSEYDITDPREIIHVDNGRGYVQ